MRISALKYIVLSWVSLLTMVIFFLVPFHAFLTVWGSKIVGHYTALRLWDEALLAISIAGVLYLLFTDHKIRFHTLSRRLVWLILCYMALNVAWGILAFNQHDVTAKALGYGLIVNLRFLVFFLVTWAVALRMARLRIHWQWLVTWPAVVVVGFGLLQIFALPNDFLKHFGYGPSTIPAVETINNNPSFVRIASTLRGANPLGAYLVIPISLVTVLLVRKGRNWRHGLFMVAALIVLFYSFSRSAWTGAAVSIATILFLSRLSRASQRIALIAAAGLVVLGLVLGLALRHDLKFQNFILHTQTHSAVSSTSDQGHCTA